jgi:hypothetical protein
MLRSVRRKLNDPQSVSLVESAADAVWEGALHPANKAPAATTTAIDRIILMMWTPPLMIRFQLRFTAVNRRFIFDHSCASRVGQLFGLAGSLQIEITWRLLVRLFWQ